MADAMEINTYEKQWVTLIIDDRPLGIMIEGSAAHEKEQWRLMQYHGVQWRRSTDADLKQFRQTIVEYETKRQIAAEKRAARKG